MGLNIYMKIEVDVCYVASQDSMLALLLLVYYRVPVFCQVVKSMCFSKIWAKGGSRLERKTISMFCLTLVVSTGSSISLKVTSRFFFHRQKKGCHITFICTYFFYKSRVVGHSVFNPDVGF